MKRYNETADQAELNRCPEPNRAEPIYLAVTRNKPMKVLHWRIVWKAYNAQLVQVGYKTLEVKHDGKPPAGSAQKFQFRYSLRGSESTSARAWDLFELGSLSAEHRGILAATAENWDGDGNCIACAKETVETMVDVSAFGGEEAAKKALRELQNAKNKDRDAKVDLFNELHNNANISLQSRRTQSWYKSNTGILKKLEKSGVLADLLK